MSWETDAAALKRRGRYWTPPAPIRQWRSTRADHRAVAPRHYIENLCGCAQRRWKSPDATRNNSPTTPPSLYFRNRVAAWVGQHQHRTFGVCTARQHLRRVASSDITHDHLHVLAYKQIACGNSGGRGVHQPGGNNFRTKGGEPRLDVTLITANRSRSFKRSQYAARPIRKRRCGLKCLT